MTGEDSVTVKEEWLSGAWWDGIHDFWDDFSEDGKLEFHSEFQGKESKFNDLSDLRIGSLGVRKTIPAHGEAVFEFILTLVFSESSKNTGAAMSARKTGIKRRLSITITPVFKKTPGITAYISTKIWRVWKKPPAPLPKRFMKVRCRIM